MITIPHKMGFDVEGILVNPAADFAWQSLDKLVSKETKKEYPRSLCEKYDGTYDDERYYYELRRSERHSTGMWPSLSLAIAALDGIDDYKLMNLAEKTVQLNPGAEGLIQGAIENFGKENVHLITSSYPAVALKIADEFKIPYSQVATNGRQIEKKKHKENFSEEVMARSPVEVLTENREELEEFLKYYVKTCVLIGDQYKALNRKNENSAFSDSNNTDAEIDIKATKQKYHDETLENIRNKELRNTLSKMFLTEEYVMGSHRKVDAMMEFEEDRKEWIFVGDGIVDAMPIDFANYGISVNMKNAHALLLSKLNVATDNMDKLGTVINNIHYFGKIWKTLKGLNDQITRVFYPRDIQKYIEDVIKVNSRAKEKLKALYKFP